MRRLAIGGLAALAAAVGCERDAPRTQPTAPQASRPKIAEPDPPPGPAVGELDCFASITRTDVPEWLGVNDVGDLDGDGIPDAAISYSIQEGKRFRTHVASYLGDGAGGFRKAQAFASGPMVYSLHLADLDADGHLDLLAPSVKERALLVYPGRGDGTFGDARQTRTGPRPGQVRTADFDGDGILDALVTMEREVQVLLGKGKGALRATKIVKVENAPESPAIADFDGDGDADVVLVHNDSMTAVTLRGRGNGRLKAAARMARVCDGPFGSRVGDLDRDGRPDVAFACLRTNAVKVLLNREGPQGFDLVDVAAEAGQALAIGDVTGDGAPDIVGLGRRPGQAIESNMTLIEGDGRGGFRVRAHAIVDGHLGDPFLADANGDGRLDIIASAWYGRRPGAIGVWLGTECASEAGAE